MHNEGVATASLVMSSSKYYIFKRMFDVVVSALALLCLSPFLLIVVILIRLDSKGKAIFTQERIGKNGRLFKLYKFRSMVLDADKILFEMLETDPELALEYKINKKLRNDPRITKIGKFIRRTSIDEIPQLINVLLGDMSLIGNRPYLPRELNDMGSYYEQIVKTKPGITGYWQVSGRSNTTFKVRCKMEAEYSNNMCLSMDIKIFFKTFIILFKGL